MSRPDDPERSTEAYSSSPTVDDRYLGMLLKDRYLIQNKIGHGGISAVYLAVDRQLLSRPVVIKVLLDSHLGSQLGDWFKRKFRQEMEALARIDHPGVVGVFDSGEMPDGKAYLVMQFVEGVTLRSVLRSQGIDFDYAGNIMRQIGQALSAAHDKGVFHRDLKPENIMIQDLGEGSVQVKLIDFGIARVKDSQVSAETDISKVPGTLPYMAPEQLRGWPTAASDVYAMGALAYEMVTGSPPYKAESSIALYEQQRTGVIVKPKLLRPNLPEAAQTAILKALAFDPNHRYTRARECGDAIALTLTGKGLPSEVVQPPMPDLITSEAPAKPTENETVTIITEPRKRRAPVTALVLAASLLGLAIIALWLWRSQIRQAIFEPPPANTPVDPVPERSLSYWVVVQKYSGERPRGEPFKLPGDIIFEKVDRVRLYLSSPQQGFLYLLSEGPKSTGELPDYVLLFPKPTLNQGSAQLAAQQQIETPEFVFDEERGTEKLWLVWSAESVAELEAVKGVVNPKERGAITDPAQIRAVRDLLTRQYASSKPNVEKDEANRQMNVKGQGNVLVNLVKLEHY
jgi:serine/threonine protein kinase